MLARLVWFLCLNCLVRVIHQWTSDDLLTLTINLCQQSVAANNASITHC